MGQVLTGKIEPILKKYTYNFEQKQMKLSVLKGSFEVDDLILNTEEINNSLSQIKSNMRVKFGVLRKFNLGVSILSRKIQWLRVDSLILIVEDTDKFKFRKANYQNYEDNIKVIYDNIKLGSKAKYLDGDKVFENEKIKFEKYQKKEHDEKLSS